MAELARTARVEVLVEGYVRPPNVAGTVSLIKARRWCPAAGRRSVPVLPLRCRAALIFLVPPVRLERTLRGF